MATEWAGVIKWIGAGTAVISLILGARQLVTIGTERAARARESAEAVAIARQQAAREDFPDAWKSLDHAEQQARTAETDAARLEVAFRWLQEARKPADQPFSTITDAIVPALLLSPSCADARRGLSGRTPSTIARMCVGVVPQHPPSTFAPA